MPSDAATVDRVVVVPSTQDETIPTRTGRRSPKLAAHRWTRWLHVYTSMIALVLVLFFGLTGITLNHPDWTFGDEVTRTSFSGTLPAGWDTDPVDFLTVVEFVRSEYGLSIRVADHSLTGDQGSVSFREPGASADLLFDTGDGSFELSIEQQGFVAVMNDLHKGRDSTSAWRWVIDVAAGFLVVIALTGLGLQFFLRKRRLRALGVAAAGLVATVALILLAF
jgi:uncharacterized protein